MHGLVEVQDIVVDCYERVCGICHEFVKEITERS
jgi:hypothetical protein